MSKDEDIKRFRETYNITFPVGKDDGFAKTLGFRVMPTTVFVTKDGNIMKRYAGEITYPELIENIEALLK